MIMVARRAETIYDIFLQLHDVLKPVKSDPRRMLVEAKQASKTQREKASAEALTCKPLLWSQASRKKRNCWYSRILTSHLLSQRHCDIPHQPMKNFRHQSTTCTRNLQNLPLGLCKGGRTSSGASGSSPGQSG